MSEPTMKQIRAGWRERLLKAELPEEVVDSFLAGVADDDLVRMKDVTDEQLLATMREALDEAEEDEDEEEEEEEEGTDKGATAKDDLTKSLSMLADLVATRVKDMIQETFGTVEVEVPELGQLLDTVAELKEDVGALSVSYKELTETWKEVGQDDASRIRDMVRDLSPGQRTRLRQSLSEPATAARVAQFREQQQRAAFPTPNQPSHRPEPGAPTVLPATTGDGVGIYDAQGHAYASLTDMARGKPIDS